MMTPNMVILTTTMFTILITTLLTTKTSIMCLNMVMYTATMSVIMSMKMNMTPMPFITFLTIIGGLMIIFLYLAATLWMKKENLTLKTKMIITSTLLLPLMLSTKMFSYTPSNSMILMFNNTLNKTTMTLIFLLILMLAFTIEIHMKANLPFRRKLKIW